MKSPIGNGGFIHCACGLVEHWHNWGSSGDSDSGTPPSCDPSGTGEVMDAPAGSSDDASAALAHNHAAVDKEGGWDAFGLGIT